MTSFSRLIDYGIFHERQSLEVMECESVQSYFFILNSHKSQWVKMLQ